MGQIPAVHPWTLSVIGLVLVLIGAYLFYKKKHPTYEDIDLPIPATRRTDMLFGYYSALTGTYEAVKDHVNLFWHSHFFGSEEFIKILQGTNCKVVLDLAPMLTTKVDGKLVLSIAAEQDLWDYFKMLQLAGVLDKITYLYPSDEPNFFVKNPAEHLKMIQMTKKVAALFPELAQARLACIYGRHSDFWNVGEFDVVGVDDYDQKSEILTIGEHARLVMHLAPHQRTILVPGPAFGHNPEPWVAYALRNPEEVEMMAAFLWFDHPDHKDVKYTGLEARSADFIARWKGAAAILLNRA